MTEETWICHYCGASPEAGAMSCPECKESLAGVCTCGEIRSVLQPACPACGKEIRKRLYKPPKGRFLKRHRRNLVILAAVVGVVLLSWNIWISLPPARSQLITGGIGRGRAAIRRGDHRAGEIALLKVLEIDPENAEAQELLVLSLQGQGRDADALEAARKAVTLDSRRSVAQLVLAEEHLRREEYLEAGQRARLALRGSPAQARFVLGRVAFVLGDVDGAIAHFELAREAGLQETPALLNLADLYRNHPRTPQPGKARLYYLQALVEAQEFLAEQPENVDVLRHLTRAQLGLDQIQDAIQGFRKLATLIPDDPTPHLAIISIYADRLNSPEEAVREARKLLVERPEEPRIHLALYRSLVGAGEEEAAAATLDRAIDRFPGSRGASLRATAIQRLVDEGKLEQARLKAEAAAAQTDHAPEVCAARAIVYERLAAEAPPAERAALLSVAAECYALASSRSNQKLGYQRRLLDLVMPGMLARGEGAGPVEPEGEVEEAALAAVDRILALRQRDPQASYWKGRLLMRTAGNAEEFEAAARHFEHAAKGFPRDEQVLTWLGHAQSSRGEPALAARALESAVAALEDLSDPSAARLYLRLASARLESAYLDGAVETCDTALERWPDAGERGDLLRVRAQALLRLRRGEEALASAVEAHRLSPGDTGGILLLGRAYEACERVKEAREHFVEAVARSPGNETRTALANFLARQGQLEEGEEQFGVLLREAPGSTRVKIAYGDFLQSHGQPVRAVEVYREASREDPASVEAAMRLADLLLSDGGEEATAEARQILARAREEAPDHPDLLVTEARLLLREDRAEPALRNLESVLRERPRDAVALYYRGYARIRLGDFGLAKADLENALRFRPNLTMAKRLLARLALEEGYRLYQAQRSEEAQGALETAARLDPELMPARLLLADTYFDLDLLDLSRKEILDVLGKPMTGSEESVRRDRAALLFLLGTMYAQKARRPDGTWDPVGLENASTAFQKMTQLDPDNWYGHYLLGIVYDRKGATTTALDCFRRARSLEPDRTEVVQAMVIALLRDQDHARAKSLLQEASRDHPARPEYPHLLGDLLRRLGERDAALEAYAEARRRDREDVEAVLTPARMLLRAGRRDEALQLVEGWLGNVQRRSAPLHSWLGDMALRDGNADKAVEHFEKALAAGGASPGVAVRLGRAHEKLGRTDKALAAYQSAIELGETALPLRMQVADLLLEMGRSGEALPLLEAIHEEAPDDLPTMNNLAHALADQKVHLDRALELAKKVNEAMPRDPAAQDTLGWVLLQSGEPERAGSYFREALQRVPADPTIRYHLAISYLRTGRREQGLRELRRLLMEELPPELVAKIQREMR
jgi:tetratricopeptide (TPR) repeat protein